VWVGSGSSRTWPYPNCSKEPGEERQGFGIAACVVLRSLERRRKSRIASWDKSRMPGKRGGGNGRVRGELGQTVSTAEIQKSGERGTAQNAESRWPRPISHSSRAKRPA